MADEGAQEQPAPATSQCIDWYAEGQARTVEVGDVRITIRLVGRKGRRARIAIMAPAGAVFRDAESEEGTPASRAFASNRR